MGIDIGFDLFPPLENNERDCTIWAAFIDNVKEIYVDDSRVVSKDDRIVFEVDEYPTLLHNGCQFRRFSSKISGSCGQAEPYIRLVFSIAESYFGNAVHFWYDFGDEGKPEPIYTWKEVHDAQPDWIDG
ncbi:hypothetical protein BGX26_007634 [Mortierella sp. AD094]|nr:hypothetical protein BGX26_007634 [Mortierella sp. AD094]